MILPGLEPKWDAAGTPLVTTYDASENSLRKIGPQAQIEVLQGTARAVGTSDKELGQVSIPPIDH